jgi:predicted chitinase/uncharacterized protein YukE
MSLATLTIPDILRWDPAAIYDVFRVVKTREQTFADFGTHLQRVQNTLADWGGDAGEAFHQSMNRHRVDVDRDGHESARVAAGVNRAEQDVEAVRTRLRAALSFASDHHLNVAEDGTVTIQPGFETNADAKKALAFEGRGPGQPGYDLTIRGIVAAAERVDDGLAAAIRAAVGDQQLDESGRPIGGAPAAPPPLVTVDQLKQIFPQLANDPAKAQLYQEKLNEAMREYGIDTPQRAAAFLAQLSVETDGFNTLTEYADGSEYEGRVDMGNVNPGDGPRYKGRGAIQLTGHNHYRDASQDPRLKMPFLESQPERAADPENAFRLAAWYWTNPALTANGQNLNALADQAGLSDAGLAEFRRITEGVRGGSWTEVNAHEDRREAAYRQALAVLGAS